MSRWTVRDTHYAASLYALALMANGDCSGAEGDCQHAVVTRAQDQARLKLERMGHQWSSLSSLQACIDAAKARKDKA